ncbi:MAG: CDGSH iron-sulfur domain-containing protein [Saprospiraceae bacterium]|nr:CDGSH iron-sulfur domain-containing protein [Saprospiraceae bacterium]
MATPKIAGKAPIPVEVEAGKRYAWCTCGESQNQPFCDGSHREAGIFSPKIEVFEEDKKIFFCTCKQTKNPGRCDGSHKALVD